MQQIDSLTLTLKSCLKTVRNGMIETIHRLRLALIMLGRENCYTCLSIPHFSKNEGNSAKLDRKCLRYLFFVFTFF